MKHNANEREKQQALEEERRQTLARDDLQAAKDQDFYTPVFVKEDVRFLQATCSKFRCA